MTSRHLLPNRFITPFGQESKISLFGKRLQNMYDKETKLENKKTITKKFKMLGKQKHLKNIKNTFHRKKNEYIKYRVVVMKMNNWIT